MQKLFIKAEKRSILGRKVKTLRRDGKLPANIYGKGVKSLAVSVGLTDFEKIYDQAGETSIVEVRVGDSKKSVLIHNVQLHPVTDLPIHADFHKVNLKEKVKAAVPVEMIGESPAVKQGLGTVVLQINELEVTALPGDLPDKFEVDLSVLDDLDKVILVKDISLDKAKVKIQAEQAEIIVKVVPLMKEEEDLPAPQEDEEESEDGDAQTAEDEAQPVKDGEQETKGEGKESKSDGGVAKSVDSKGSDK